MENTLSTRERTATGRPRWRAASSSVVAVPAGRAAVIVSCTSMPCPAVESGSEVCVLPMSNRWLRGSTAIDTRATGGRTKVPTPRRISMAAARSSSATASRTVSRLTPNSAHISGSLGSRELGRELSGVDAFLDEAGQLQIARTGPSVVRHPWIVRSSVSRPGRGSGAAERRDPVISPMFMCRSPAGPDSRTQGI